jgi:hypothetical protein
MNQFIRFPLGLVFLVSTSLASAQAKPLPKPEAEARAKTLAPFLDDETIAIAHVDLARVDVDQLVAFIETSAPGGRLGELAPVAKALAAQITEAGGRDIYLVVSLADVPERTPFVLAPLGKRANADRLTEALANLPLAARQRIGDVLVAGDRETLERLQRNHGSARPELTRAFEAAGDTAAQLLLLPTSDARRVLEELTPSLPAEIGGGPITVVTRGAMWLALGAVGPPRPALRLVVQSRDNAAATALAGRLRQWLPLVARLGEREQALARLPELSKRLVPAVEGDRLVLSLSDGDLEEFRALLTPSVKELDLLAARRQSINNLKQIGLAMHGYADVHKHFPPAAIRSLEGKPLLSWRVALLPYLEAGTLYKEFHLDEPWDSEHNRKLIDRMPNVFKSPSLQVKHDGRTGYVVPVGPGTVFEGPEGMGFRDITDGTSNTIGALEVAEKERVVWTQPADWDFDPAKPSAGLTTPYAEQLLVLFCDGSVRLLKWPMDAERLRRLMTRNGGERVENE